jgi:zinc transport system substrate-binding protein
VRSKPFITYHDAFPYFVRRYGLQLAGVVEETPDVEPSPRYLARLSQTVREKGVNVIFTEPQFSSKLVQQITRDLHISTGQLDPLETAALTSTSYEEGMRNNARTLQEALSK